MNRVLLIGAIFSGLAACASSAPEPEELVAHVETVATVQPESAASKPVADDNALHVVDVPEAAPVAYHAPKDDTPDRDELICKRIKTTGSHRMTRVCVTRAEIEQRRAESQAMLRKAGATPDGFKRESIRTER